MGKLRGGKKLDRAIEKFQEQYGVQREGKRKYQNCKIYTKKKSKKDIEISTQKLFHFIFFQTLKYRFSKVGENSILAASI